MTDRTTYYQRKNTASRKHGGHFVCPLSGDVLYRIPVGWHCPSCGFDWDHDGEVIEKEGQP